MSMSKTELLKLQNGSDVRGIACEGIENEHNAQKLQELNKVQAQLIGSQNNLKQQLQSVQEKIDKLSSTATDRILEAIKNQRWYFFKNKQHILMDKTTAILWANLDYFPYNQGPQNCGNYLLSEAHTLVNNYNVDGINDWQIPTLEVFKHMIYDKTFPFQQGSDWLIKGTCSWHCNINNWSKNKVDLDNWDTFNLYNSTACVLPCSYFLIKDSEYEKIYLKITMFIQKKKDYNSLWTYLKKTDFCLYLMMLKSLSYTRKYILKNLDYCKH